MITKTMYRYRDSRGLVDTPNLPPKGTVYETLTQLVADVGKDMTDGTLHMGVVNTTDATKWTEVDAPPEPSDTDPESIVSELEGLV